MIETAKKKRVYKPRSQMEHGRYKLIDLTGQSFGQLTAIRKSDKPSRTPEACWDCLCSCGNEYTARGTRLRSGFTKCCKECRNKKGRKIAVGQRYNSWTIVKIPTYTVDDGRHILVRCDCGRELWRDRMSVRHGTSKSCNVCANVVARDLVGQRIGNRAILSRAENTSSGQTRWLCRCDCGDESILNDIKDKCNRCASDESIIDISGQKFNAWTVLGRSGKTGKHAIWTCQCDCGVVKELDSWSLRSGSTKGCQGCSGYRVRSIFSRFGELRCQGFEGLAIHIWDHYCPDVISVNRGPHVKAEGLRIYPDFLITKSDNSKTVVEIKSVWTLYGVDKLAKGINPEIYGFNEYKYNICRNWCKDQGYEFVLWCMDDEPSFQSGLVEQGYPSLGLQMKEILALPH